MKQFVVGATLILGLGVFLAPVTPVGAIDVDPLQGVCENPTNADSQVCASKDDDVSSVITTIVNVLLYIVGIISVVMIIIGGIMYSTSAGDAGAVTKAKNTILYSIVGLVVAFLAFAVVNWVIGRL